MTDTALPQILQAVGLLLLDVDGVLTDGGIIYSDAHGETKIFNVKDGLGLRMIMGAGIEVGLITGRTSKALHLRCQDLGIRHVWEGVRHKAQLLEEIQKETGVGADQTAFIGDDIPDLPLMRQVGLAISVADAHEAVRNEADWITTAPGGRGAVREVCDALLKARGQWEKLMEQF